MARHAREFEPEGDDLEAIDLDREDEGYGSRPARVRNRTGDDDEEADERRWSTRRRWTVAIVVAVVAAVVTTVVAANREDPARDVTLSVPTTGAGSPPVTNELPPRIGPTVRALRTAPFVVAGARGVLLVDRREVAAQRLAPSLSSDAAVVDRAGSVVIVADREERVVVDATGERPTVSQGDANVFVARRGNDAWSAAGTTLRSVYRDIAYRAPRGHLPIAEVDGGFLVRAPTGSLAVWSPHAKQLRSVASVVRHVVAVRPDRVAWTGADCGSLRCPLHLTDLTTGTDVIVGAPFVPGDAARASNGAGGRFSPDGRYLAVITPNRNGASSGVAVIDLTTGRARPLYSLYGSLRMSGADSEIGRPLPFDWSPDGRTLLAIEPGDTFSATRLAVIDPSNGRASLSGDALPFSTSLVSIGVKPPAQVSPPLPPSQPLLGAPTGITIVNVVGTDVERLDLDTGRVTRAALAPPKAPGTDDSTQVDRQVVPLAEGALVQDQYATWFVPRTGAPRVLGAATAVFGENRERGWIAVEAGSGTTLVPVDGHTGATGPPVPVFTVPVGASTAGFVEMIGPTLDDPGSIAVWDPSTRERRPIDTGTRKGVYVMATAGERVVWTGYCDGEQFTCGVNVTDVANGTTREYGDWSVRTLSLAPDGSAAVFVPIAGDGAGTPQYLDLASGRVTELPGANGVGRVVWGPGGWLFYSTDEADSLAAWRPGLAEPRALPGVLSVFAAAAAI
jgi:hypothetical protein